MTGFPLWVLALSAAVDLRVATPEETRPECSAQALVETLQVLRPELRIRAGEATPETLSVTLQHRGGAYVLRFRGPDVAVERSFPDSGDCLGAIRTGALIIDGALDQLVVRDRSPALPPIPAPPPVARPPPAPAHPPAHPSVPPPAPPPASRPPPPAPPRWEWAGAVGAGAGQGTFSAAPAVALETTVNRGLLQLGAAADVLTTTTAPVKRGIPADGSYAAFDVNPTVAIGVAPRLGPGRISADAVGGLTWTSAQVVHTISHDLQAGTATELFAAFRLSYALDLPARFFLLGQAEERFAPLTGPFDVRAGDGAIVSIARTRSWTAVGVLAVGRHFF